MAYAYPMQPVETDPTAVMGKRIGAFFIDLAIAVFVIAMIFSVFATKLTVEETLSLPGCHRKFDQPSQIECSNRQVVQLGDTVYEAEGGATFGLDFVFVLLYFAILPGITGATVGKYATGVRVVDADGRIANMGKSLLRWLLFAVDGTFTLFLCGLITSLTSKGHRRLGDMAAGTFVVDKNAVGHSIGVAAPPQPYGAAPPSMYGAPPPSMYGTPPPPPASAAPQWDASRGAYVQWDPATGRYVAWDPTTQTWR